MGPERLCLLGAMAASGAKRVFEIGINEGNFFHEVFSHPTLSTKIKEYHAIDPWPEDIFRYCYSKNNRKAFYAFIKKVVKLKVWKQINIIREYSYNVYQKYPDEYFDFGFLDGNHEEEGIRADIENFFPKIRKGGVLTGHDYDYKPKRKGEKWKVKEVVNEIFGDRVVVFPGHIWMVHND